MRIVHTLAGLALALAAQPAIAGAQGSITGTVYDSLSAHGPLANATVVLVERSRYATTDARGHFKFDTVPDGRYTVAFTHPVLDSLDLELPGVAAEVSGGRVATVALATPSAATAYAAICPTSHEGGSGVVIGRVRDVDQRTPLVDAAVTTEWADYTIQGGHAAGHRVHTEVRTSRGGVYLLCGVPTHVPLEVRAVAAGFGAGPSALSLDDRLMRRVDFAVSEKDAAARVESPVDSIAGTATLRGHVRGADGQALRDAVVGVAGTDRTTHSDAAGSFRLEGIPAGTRTIELRSIGFLPERYTFDFATHAVRDTVLSVSRQAQDLKADTVRTATRSLSLMETDGFDERRAHALGAYLTDREIARHVYPDLGTVLGVMRGVHLERDGAGNPIPLVFGTLAGYCKPNIFLDGALYIKPESTAGIQAAPSSGRGGSSSKISGGGGAGPRLSAGGAFTDLSLLARPELIKGIEVYSNPGTIPAQYDLMSSTGCGSIVIWTR